MARERDERLDILRVAAIVLVVAGHAITLVYGRATRAPWPIASLFSVLSVLDVPLFVFVSGYLTPAVPGVRWLGRRAARLLVPFFAWAVVQWVVWYRASGGVWLLRVAVLPAETNALWFLYALFVMSALLVIVGRRRAVLVAAAIALLIVAPISSPLLSIRYAVMFFPLFAAGRIVAARRFEPGPWVIAVAAVMVAAMWTEPGANMLFATPAWTRALASATVLWPVDLVAPSLGVLRCALELSLVASAFWLARNARRGAWSGASTLGVYCAHILLLPAWAKGAGSVIDLGIVFAFAIVSSFGVAVLLERWETTSFLLLGSGRAPAWARWPTRSP